MHAHNLHDHANNTNRSRQWSSTRLTFLVLCSWIRLTGHEDKEREGHSHQGLAKQKRKKQLRDNTKASKACSNTCLLYATMVILHV